MPSVRGCRAITRAALLSARPSCFCVGDVLCGVQQCDVEGSISFSLIAKNVRRRNGQSGLGALVAWRGTVPTTAATATRTPYFAAVVATWEMERDARL